MNLIKFSKIMILISIVLVIAISGCQKQDDKPIEMPDPIDTQICELPYVSRVIVCERDYQCSDTWYCWARLMDDREMKGCDLYELKVRQLVCDPRPKR